jgi:outer membrane protein OmpA-like peptidoglycan-associated protein
MLLTLATKANAQPVEDPGLSEPAPPPKPAQPTQPPPKLEPHQFAPTVSVAPPPEVHETVDTKVTWEKGGAAAPAEGDLYERVAGSTVFGPVGLLRTLTGDSGRTNTFRIALHLGGFQQSDFLIAGAGTLKGDQNGRFTGDLTINYTPWKFIELYLALFNSSNQNTRTDPGRTDPEVILSLGDLQLGAKGRYPVLPFMDLALHLGVKFLNSVSGVLFDGNSTNVAVDLIASWDLRHATLTRNVPLRFHINFGFLYDNSLSLLPAGQCALSTGNDPCIRSRVVETFAYGIGTNRLRVALAVDAPVLIKTVGLQPFIEYHVDASVGDGDTVIRHALMNVPSVQGDRLNKASAMWLTLGLRLRPVAGLFLDLGLDVGLSSPGFQYGAPVPQWNLMAGAGYAYDGSSAGASKTKVVTKTITREISRGATVGRLRGVVRDATTKKAISGAIVRYVNRHENSQLTDPDGTFVSYGLAPGRVEMEVSREDYMPTPAQAMVVAHGETPLEVLLVVKPPQSGTLRGHVTNTESQPINATVRLTSSHGAIVDADIEGPGKFTAKLPQGEYTMDVVADGYLAKQRGISVSSGQVSSIDVMLAKKPAQSHVSLGKGEITVKGVIHFGTNNADIRPDSEQLLDEIVDFLVRNQQLKRIRIEGHTDNRGQADRNLELSKARANSVMGYLIKQGIDPARLQAEGYGASQPLVPNLTPANRAKNRRVAFKIVDAGGIPLE